MRAELEHVESPAASEEGSAYMRSIVLVFVSFAIGMVAGALLVLTLFSSGACP